ncbi:MAG TPA: CdaR family protein [Clostridiales bacterium]|nr:CdaR family protein [Clostridiales bacterium]
MDLKREKEIFKKSPTVRLSRKLYDSVKVNFTSKLIFLLIGIALWLNINLQKDYETTVDIPIRLNNIIAGKTLLDPIPEKARIKIRSKGKDILLSDFSEDVYFEIDGSTFTDSATIRINMDYFVNSSGTELEPLFIFHPQEISIIYDDLMNSKVPVILDYRFTPAPGYVTSGKFRMHPDSVTITGPESKVKKIKSIRTSNISEDNVTAGFSKKIDLITIDPASLKYSDISVTVSQEVVRKGAVTFKAPIRIINKPENMNLLLDPIAVDITVVGPVSELQMITSDDFSVTADAGELDNITNKIPIKASSELKLEWKHSANEVRAIQY